MFSCSSRIHYRNDKLERCLQICLEFTHAECSVRSQISSSLIKDMVELKDLLRGKGLYAYCHKAYR